MASTMLFLTTLIACVVAAHSAAAPTSDYTPVIWPQPASVVFGPELYLMNPEKLYIKLMPHTPELGKTIYRLKRGLVTSAAANQVNCSATAAGPVAPGAPPPVILKLSLLTVTVIDVITPPGLGTDESYTITVNSLGALISAPTMAGAMWGLETFTQLAATCNDTANYGQVVLRAVTIADAPRFPHRGLLLDTSRHYLPLSNIYDHIDAMVMNKLNVLHWHIVDDPSFPLVSAALPDLSLGAFSPAHTYTAKSIGKVIKYANSRGVRVMVELDTPGHTASWAVGYPDLVTECFNAAGVSTGRHGPLDPSQNATYVAVGKLLAEAAGLFKDGYLHLGGDEVDFACWKSNPNVTAYMKEQGLATPQELEVHYMKQIVNQTATLNRTAVLWQEMFDDGLRPNSTTEPTVFQVWKVEDPEEQLDAAERFHTQGMEASRKMLMRAAVDKREAAGYMQELKRITKAGYPVLLSAPWYLDRVAYGERWVDYYLVEPQGFAGGDGPQGDLVLGGEACLWGEFVDTSNSIPRAWPSAAAVAERLWSPADVTDVDAARERLQVHRCRMVARGVAAEPMGPGFCPGSFGY